MKRLKIMGLMLLALLAFGAYTASMASAVEGVLPAAAFTGEGGEQVLETLSGEFIKCEKLSILEGAFNKGSDDEGTANLHFTGCTTTFGGAVKSLGDESKVILEKVKFKICLVKELVFGIAIEGNSNPVHIEGPLGTLILVKGQVIAELEGAGLAGKHFSYKLEGKEGHQTVALKCTFLGKELKHTYEAAKDSSAKDEHASQKGLFLILFTEEVKLEDV